MSKNKLIATATLEIIILHIIGHCLGLPIPILAGLACYHLFELAKCSDLHLKPLRTAFNAI